MLFINLDPGEDTDMAAAGKQHLLQMAFGGIYPALGKYDGGSGISSLFHSSSLMQGHFLLSCFRKFQQGFHVRQGKTHFIFPSTP